MYSIQHCVIKLASDLRAGMRFSPGTQVPIINKTDRHDITKILLIVRLNTITLTHYNSTFACIGLFPRNTVTTSRQAIVNILLGIKH